MTAPVSSPHLADLMAARDSSLPLAAAALARVADEQGHAPFSELAIAYREEFLTLRAHSREAGLPELGGLSVEEFRTSLRTSVLPRLALMKVVTYAAAALEDAAPIAFTVEAWEEIGADRAASADRLLGAAEHALTRAESASGEHPVVRGGSRLTATGLLKAYKGRSVVNDVSVQLDQGEIVGLLGPNGAGKTTSFYMITGLIRPEAGRITLDGRDLSQEPMYRRAQLGIGYLAQEPSVFRKLSVEENVLATDGFGARVRMPRRLEQRGDRPRPVGDEPRPHLGAERDGRVVPQPPDRQRDQAREREARQHRRLEVGPGVVHGEDAGVVHGLPTHRGDDAQEILAIRHRQAAEGRVTTVIRDTDERRRRQRQRGVAAVQQLGQGGHRTVPGFLVVSGGAGGRGSRCTPSARPPTTTRSMRACRMAMAILCPRE